MSETPKEVRDRWRTRRLMAWIAFWMLIFIIPVSFMLPDSAQKIVGVIQLVAPSLAAILMMYIGAAAYDDVNNKS